MRRTVTAIIILLFSLTIGIFSYFFVKNACNQTISGVEEVMQSALTEDTEAVNRFSVQANRIWQNKVFLLNILIGREYTGDVSKYLNKITYYSEIADWDSVITNSEDCKAELTHIIQSNEPDLSTVF